MPVCLLQLETWPQLPPGSTKINLGSYKENSAENWYRAWTLSMLQDFQAISIPLFLVTAVLWRILAAQFLMLMRLPGCEQMMLIFYRSLLV